MSAPWRPSRRDLLVSLASLTGAAVLAPHLDRKDDQMGEQLPLDEGAALYASIDRRLRALEATQRVGLNRIRLTWSTTHADADTLDAWDFDPPSTTWEDDQGTTGTGMPTLTVKTGRRIICFAQASVTQIGSALAYKANGGYIGVGIDGADPVGTWPRAMTRFRNYDLTAAADLPVNFILHREDLTPGEHTFRVGQNWLDNLGTTTWPQMYAITLAVLPLD